MHIWQIIRQIHTAYNWHEFSDIAIVIHRRIFKYNICAFVLLLKLALLLFIISWYYQHESHISLLILSQSIVTTTTTYSAYDFEENMRSIKHELFSNKSSQVIYDIGFIMQLSGALCSTKQIFNPVKLFQKKRNYHRIISIYFLFSGFFCLYTFALWSSIMF